ncbi:MAG: HAMP domain-containing sensor histidine kinase [Myxococcota bacterium]
MQSARGSLAWWAVAPFALAVLLCLFLLGAAGLLYRSSLRLTDAAARGQAEAWVAELRQSFRGRSEELEAFAERHRANGLLHLSVRPPHPGPTHSAGDPPLGDDGQILPTGVTRVELPLFDGPPGPPQHRIPPPGRPPNLSFGAPLPGPPPGMRPGRRPLPAPGPRPGRPPLPFGAPAHPTVVMEFRSQAIRELTARAQTVWASALGASGLVILAALGFGGLLRQRRQLELELEDDRRLASLGQMSAVLAHELRNPLTSLKGHAQLLEAAVSEQGRLASKAQRVLSETVRIERLVDDLLEFVRSRDIDRSRTDLVRLIAAVVDELGAQGRVKVVADGGSYWNLDAQRMHHVFANLIQNALQSDSSGTITVRLTPHGEVLEVTVDDEGPGIDSADLETIFEPFRTHRTRGTGLGLTISRQIVEAHGGRIEASNRPEGGARFALSIPSEAFA